MFDGSSREVCVSRRIRTNTPLQALVTLNDSSFLVAARQLAKGMTQQKAEPKEQIRAGYKSILVHDIAAEKLDVLEGLYNEAIKEYKGDKLAAAKITASQRATPELAAMTIVANALLNLDEVITKE